MTRTKALRWVGTWQGRKGCAWSLGRAGEGVMVADGGRAVGRAGPSGEGLPLWAMVRSWEFVLTAVRVFSRAVSFNFQKLLRAALWRVISVFSNSRDTLNSVFSCSVEQ